MPSVLLTPDALASINGAYAREHLPVSIVNGGLIRLSLSSEGVRIDVRSDTSEPFPTEAPTAFRAKVKSNG